MRPDRPVPRDRRRSASHRISIALGKALGSGMPVGAAMVSRKSPRRFRAGDHGTTYGGNLLACRAALVFLDALEGGLIRLDPAAFRAHLFAGAARRCRHATRRSSSTSAARG